MSRLNKYIKEEVKDQNWYLDKFVPLIQKDCKEFLKEIRGAKGMLSRIEGAKGEPILKRTVRSDRRPLDSKLERHEWFDDYFLKKFGWRARSNVLFTWGRRFNIISLHDWLVFPVDKYKIVWNDDIVDLYDMGFSKDDWIGVAQNYTDKHLKKAVTSEVEVMLNAKEVYMVRGYLIWDINERLNLNWQGLKRRI